MHCHDADPGEEMTAPIARDEVERILAASGKGCGPVIVVRFARSLLAAYDENDRLRALVKAAVEAELVRIEMEWRSHPALDAARRNLRSRIETLRAEGDSHE